MSQIKDRIIGTEMEYGIMVSNPRNPTLIQVANSDFSPYVAQCIKDLGIAKSGSSHNYFLGNGARLYGDVRERREYATPEDTSLFGTVANEIIGEMIVQKSAELYGQDKGVESFVSKRVIDEMNETCGYHVSYSADAETVQINDESLALFGVFAATRSILFGAGALMRNGRYIIGQKSSRLETEFALGTTSRKPVVNIRNEPHADGGQWVRVHDTSSDATMSPWATANKIGAASIVLRLIENGRTMDDVRFNDPLYNVAHLVATDTTLTTRLHTKGGGSLTAIETHKRIIKEARELEAENGLSPSEQYSLEEWERAIIELEQDPRLLADRADWVLKLGSLKRLRERHGWSWQSPQLRSKDRQFSDLSERGLGLKLRERAWSKYMPEQQLLDERVQQPPSTTRAHLRGSVIQHHHAKQCDADLRVDWAVLQHGDDFLQKLSNPFAVRNRAVEKHFGLEPKAA